MITSLVLMLTLSAAPAVDPKSLYGIPPENFTDALFSNAITSGGLWVPVSKELKAMAPAARVAAVPVLGKAVRAWFASDDFKARYATWRNEALAEKVKPLRPVAQIQAEMRKQYAVTRVEQEEGLKSLPKDAQKEVRKAIDEMAKQQEASIADTTTLEAIEKMRFDAETQSYEENLKAHPESPATFIKGALTRALENTQDVDFAAKLKDGRTFVNRDYESKPLSWKQCYRAGKAPCEAARAFATQWLAELK